jgi:hypothetical protein
MLTIGKKKRKSMELNSIAIGQLKNIQQRISKNFIGF